MGKLASTKSTFGSMTTSQVTVDLPKSSGTAVSINLNPTGGDRYVQLALYAGAAYRYAYAATSAAAISALGSNTTSRVVQQGDRYFPIVGNTGYLAVIAYADTAVTDGLSYEFIEADEGQGFGG